MKRYLYVLLAAILFFSFSSQAADAGKSASLNNKAVSVGNNTSTLADDLQAALDQNANYAKINAVLDKMVKKLQSAKTTSADTTGYIQALGNATTYLIKTKAVDQDNMKEVQKRLDALGEAPGDGMKEAPDIAKKRKEFTAELDGFKAQIAEADLTQTKIDQINKMILNLRNQELLNNIFMKDSSIFHPQEFFKSTGEFAKFLYEIIKSPFTWYDGLDKAGKQSVQDHMVNVGITMLVALFVAWYLSLFLKKHFGYKEAIEKPGYGQKVSAAIWMLIAKGAIPAGVIGAFLYWLNNYPVMDDNAFGVFLQNAAAYLLAIFLIQAVVSVVFVPNYPKWRLIDVGDDKAKRLSHTLLFSIIAISLVMFFQTMATDMRYSTDMIYSLKILSNAVKAGCIILVSYRFLYDTKALTLEQLQSDEDVGSLSTSSKISLVLIVFAAAAFAPSLLGYIRLSEFILNRFIVSVIVIGAFYIINEILRVLFHQALLWSFWTRQFRISRRTLVKTEFWFGFILTPVLFILAALFLLGLWGVSVDILLQETKKILTGFDIGGVRISLVSIFLGIAAFFVSLFLFKLLKNSVLNGALTKIDMDAGVRSSLAAGIGFFGFILSIIFGLAVMGGSFGSIAIVAGALSFGAGLGLQNIVNNFVSGIILIFERPIKVGDWIVVNGQEGIVQQINMRATELQTFVKSTVIIPNSDILSNSLTNKTYGSRLGRADLKVGVGYDSDLRMVKSVLMSIVENHPAVLKTPAPFVAFVNMGESSLDFQVGFYLSNISDGFGVSNDIREQIIDKFRQLHIEIPYPQRDVHIINPTPAGAINDDTKTKDNSVQ